MTEENLTNLTINYLSENKYSTLKETGTLNENELYMTPSSENEKNLLLDTYPVGSIYTNDNVTNPSELFGGTWELIKKYNGGELIAFGSAIATAPGNEVLGGNNLDFTDDNCVKNRFFEITNYVDDEILKKESNTFKVTTKGIVGMVKMYYEIGGWAYDKTYGIWCRGSIGDLPEGVSILSTYDYINGYIAPVTTGNYTGANFQRIFKVSTDSNISFLIKPEATPAGGNFKMCTDGVATILSVEVYAKANNSFVWKRTA